MAKTSLSSAAWWVVSTRGREERGKGCMSDREGVRVRNGMLVVEGKEIGYCC